MMNVYGRVFSERLAMSIGLCYWVLMLVWLVFGLWSAWPVNGPNARSAGGTLLLFILLVLIGWAQFGPPIHR